MRRYLFLAMSLVAVALAGCTTEQPAPTATVTTSPTPTVAPVDYSAWATGASAPIADPLYPAHGNPNIDVLHYGLDLSWVPDTRTFTGQATVRLRAVNRMDQVSLDFSSAYRIDGVTLDSAAVTGTTSGDKLTVAVALAKDALATLVVRYHGTPTNVPMPTKRGDIENLGLTVTADGSLWTMQEPYGAFTWYPANDQPSDKALYDIAVTVPDGWSAIASGTPASQQRNTFRYTTKDPVASYLTTLAVGRYQKETATGPDNLPLTYWFLPDTDEATKAIVRKSPQMLTWLTQHFGPYPFPTGGAVMVASASAMETQQLVTMGKLDATAKSNELSVMEVDLLHEYAHQWFGDTVSPDSWQDLWLNEGWAMYAQDIYVAEFYHYSPAEITTWLRDSDRDSRSKWGPPGHPQADSFGASNVYTCGAMMLRTIQLKVGDDAFASLARDWVAARNHNTNQNRATFIAFVNQHTGTDFTSLISTWLDSPSTPS